MHFWVKYIQWAKKNWDHKTERNFKWDRETHTQSEQKRERDRMR